MAGTLTLNGEGLCLDWLFNTAASPVRPAAYYLSLHTMANGGSGLIGEIVGNGYARQLITFSRTGNQISNTNSLSFGPATADWGAVSDVCIWDSLTGGNCIAQGTDSAVVVYANGDTATVAIGALFLVLI